MAEIEAVIFDIGGVLWRANGVRLSDKWAAICGLPADEFDQIVFASEWGHQAIEGLITSEEKWRNIGNRLQLTPLQLQELTNDSWQGKWDDTLFEYIRTTLKPRYKLGILSDATSNTRERIAPWINADLFDEIIISAEEKVRKPNPRIYQITLERLGVEADKAVFFDDRQWNIDAAHALGMHAFLYTEFEPFLASMAQVTG